MKHLLSLCCLCLLGVAQAQLPATYDPAFDARERARIDAERAAAQQAYGQEEADCYQRFAVNDCLREVRKRRRVTLEELRRQEIVLNDARRAAAAAEQVRRVEQRSAEREEPVPRGRDDTARPERENAGARAPVAAASAPVRPAAPDAARRAEQQRAYELRQRQAEERRLQREQQQREQGPRNSKPLPVPP